MNILTICIPLVTAIFAMAYPLAINVIGSINSKYNSERLVVMFRREREWKWFNRLLYISLGLIAVYGLGRLCGFSLVITHVLIVLIFISTTFLSYSLIVFVKKILLYKSDILLKDNLLSKDDPKKDLLELYDLFVYFIRKEPVAPDYELLRFFSQYYNFKRNTALDEDGKIIIFDSADYDIIRQLNRIVLDHNANELVLLQYNVAGGGWLIGDGKKGMIDEKTFRVIWYNLSDSLEANKDYIILKFWENIFDYWYSLPVITLSLDEELQPAKRDEVEIREKERSDVRDFAIALGGLLLVGGRFNIINVMFYYKQTNQPDLRVFPIRAHDVFVSFFKFFDIGDYNFPAIGLIYPFPQFHGDDRHDTPKLWKSKFIVLLYLRLFTVNIYGTYGYEVADIENDSRDTWRKNLPHFERLLEEILSNKILIKSVFSNRTFVTDPRAEFERVKGLLD